MSLGGREGALVPPSPLEGSRDSVPSLALSPAPSAPDRAGRGPWEPLEGAQGSFQALLTPNIPLRAPPRSQNSPPSPAPSLKSQVLHPGAAPSLGPCWGVPGRGCDRSGHCSGEMRGCLGSQIGPQGSAAARAGHTLHPKMSVQPVCFH